jgi:hypothetical protein
MYARYYNEARTHLSLGKDALITRPVERAGRCAATGGATLAAEGCSPDGEERDSQLRAYGAT